MFDPDLCEPLARVLGGLGSRRAFVVHGHGGLDEVSLLGPTRVAELRDGDVRTFTFAPADVGVATCEPADLAGGDPERNAAIIRSVLEGDPGPASDAVAINAGFCSVLGGLDDDIADGVTRARAVLADGRAGTLLERFVAASAPEEAP